MTEHIETPQEEHVVHEFFLASVILKGFISVAEVVAGIAVLLIPPQTIISLTLSLLNYLPVASIQAKLIQEVSVFTSGTALFIAFYLLSRGLIKVALVWAMLKRIVIAYPLSLGVLTLLVLYQLYQLVSFPFSLIVFAITIFDLVVMYFIYREWKIIERHLRGKQQRLQP